MLHNYTRFLDSNQLTKKTRIHSFVSIKYLASSVNSREDIINKFSPDFIHLQSIIDKNYWTGFRVTTNNNQVYLSYYENVGSERQVITHQKMNINPDFIPVLHSFISKFTSAEYEVKPKDHYQFIQDDTASRRLIYLHDLFHAAVKNTVQSAMPKDSEVYLIETAIIRADEEQKYSTDSIKDVHLSTEGKGLLAEGIPTTTSDFEENKTGYLKEKLDPVYAYDEDINTESLTIEELQQKVKTAMIERDAIHENSIHKNPLSKPLSNIPATIYKTNVGIKVADLAINALRVYDKGATTENTLKVTTNCVQLVGMAIDKPEVLIVATVPYSLHQLYIGNYMVAATSIISAAGYTLIYRAISAVRYTLAYQGISAAGYTLPGALATSVPKLTLGLSVGLAAYAGYTTIQNGYSLYNKWDIIEDSHETSSIIDNTSSSHEEVMNIDHFLKEAGITTRDLVWNIQGGNFLILRMLIPDLTSKDLLEKEFENGNTLMHLIYSSANVELISTFNEHLASLIKSGDLSPEKRSELLEKKNKGGYTPVERLLQEDSVARVYGLFKGTSDLELDGDITKNLHIALNKFEDEEFDYTKQKIAESACKAVGDYSLWSDPIRFIKSYTSTDEKTLLTEKYFSVFYEENGPLDAIELASDTYGDTSSLLRESGDEPDLSEG